MPLSLDETPAARVRTYPRDCVAIASPRFARGPVRRPDRFRDRIYFFRGSWLSLEATEANSDHTLCLENTLVEGPGTGKGGFFAGTLGTFSTRIRSLYAMTNATKRRTQDRGLPLSSHRPPRSSCSSRVTPPFDEDAEKFVRLVAANHDRLFRYIYSLCPNEADARDILQETWVALLKASGEYDESRPFLPWAYRFAKTEVLKHRDRTKRTRRVLDPDVILLLDQQRASMDEALNERLTALEECVAALSAEDRQLVEFRYQSRRDAADAETHLGISRRTLFRQLKRVRNLLLDCITSRTKGGQG